jgi:renalase
MASMRNMSSFQPQKIAVIGSGVAGAACAQRLSRAGHAVHLFDKARGPGGRLATRRLDWLDAQGRPRTARFDHGAVAITAQSCAFQGFIDRAVHAGWISEWVPKLLADSLPPEAGTRQYVAMPDMPALCRYLVQGVAATWSFAVDRLHRGQFGWQLHAGSDKSATLFDAVVLALPPAQAAPLLAPHRIDWSRHASVIPMQPCWTLMGISVATEEEAGPAARWDLALPAAGPLACVLRCDLRPGRESVPGQAHWVLHARAGWSRRHLEQPAQWVQSQLQLALANHLGGQVHWLHSTVHRWRYAMPRAHRLTPATASWWDATQGLGVCGDFLGGGSCGAEGPGCRRSRCARRCCSTPPARHAGTPAPCPRPRSVASRPDNLFAARHDTAQHHLPRQQGRTAEQTLYGLRPTHELAPQLGEKLGRSEVLLRRLSSREGPTWLSCAI